MDLAVLLLVSVNLALLLVVTGILVVRIAPRLSGLTAHQSLATHEDVQNLAARVDVQKVTQIAQDRSIATVGANETIVTQSDLQTVASRAQVENLPTVAQVQAGLASAQQTNDLRNDVARLRDEVARLNASNDAVLGFVQYGAPARPPHVEAIVPARGTTGTQVRIFGTGFHADSSVYFGLLAANEKTVETTATILVRVPAGVTDGDVDVYVHSQNRISNSVIFTAP